MMGNPESEVSDKENAKPKMENRFAEILRGYRLDEDVVSKFVIKEDINFADMAALVDEDLVLMGIQCAETRETIINDFKNNRSQMNHYERFIAEMDVGKYTETVYKNAALQLLATQNVLTTLNEHLKSKPFEENFMVDDVYFTTLVLKALKEMQAVTASISIKEKQSIFKRMGSVFCNWRTVAVISGAFTAFAVYKLQRR